MKVLIFVSMISSMATTALADVYSCIAKANPARGISQSFEVQVKPAQVGGLLTIKANGRETKLGKITQIAVFAKDNPTQRQVFDLTLGLIHEPDVSGVPANDINKITAIKVLQASTAQGEASVYQLFSGSQQVGGTILIDMQGTACLPASSAVR